MAEAPGPEPRSAPGDAIGRWALVAHAVALVAVLALSALLVGGHGAYSADEGAVEITAVSVASGDGWLTAHPAPEVDPAGREYPLVSSDWGSEGVSAYAKHPLYVVALAAGERTWPGGGGMVAVSVAGVAVAALLAALLARRVAPGAEVVTLWLVGVGSPLFVDAQLLMAHAAAAATGAAAVLAALHLTATGQRRSGVGRDAVLLGAMALATCATAMLRTEGVLLAVGLAVALGVRALDRDRARSVLGAAAALGGALAAVLLDRLLVRQLVGTPVDDPSSVVPLGASSFLERALDGFYAAVLRPSYASGSGADLQVLALVLVVGAGILLVRRSSPAIVAGLLASAGAIVLLRAVALPPAGVPGLVVAFPVGILGLLAALGHRVRSDPRRTVAVAAAVYVVGVALTQYAVGGGVEWGGRYYALAIPLVAPFAAGGLRAASASFVGPSRVVAGVGLALLVAGMGVLGVRTLAASEDDAQMAFANLPEPSSELGARPVVVTSALPVPRFAGRDFEDHRWLLVDPAEPRDLVARLRSADVEQFVLMTRDPSFDAPVVRGARLVASTQVGGWEYLTYAT